MSPRVFTHWALAILIVMNLGRREAVVLSLLFSLTLIRGKANRDACEGILIF